MVPFQVRVQLREAARVALTGSFEGASPQKGKRSRALSFADEKTDGKRVVRKSRVCRKRIRKIDLATNETVGRRGRVLITGWWRQRLSIILVVILLVPVIGFPIGRSGRRDPSPQSTGRQRRQKTRHIEGL